MDSSKVQPSIWCLLGRKAGDNAQVQALAAQLGYTTQDKTIVARPWELLVHLGPRASLAGIDAARSSALAAPWPDLVISAGRRNEPVAHWIKQRSGGRTRLVHIGRPWAAPNSYDMVVTTLQYFLPQQGNIVCNTLPLHRMLPDELRDAGRVYAQQWQHLPRPWIAVLVGGDSGRFVFTPAKAKRLGEACNAMASSRGGSLLITDSPRTSLKSGDALAREISAPHIFYRCSGGGDNPYLALLDQADEFIVTGESMSMLAESASVAKPLHIFDMGDDDTLPWWRVPHNFRYKPLSHRLAMRLGPLRMRRDVGNIQRALVDGGRANWLGAATSNPPATPADDELAKTADRVRLLLPPY